MPNQNTGAGPQILENSPVDVASVPVTPPAEINLPASAWDAIFRGARGHCPRCDGAGLFYRFLKPVAHCSHCGGDWTPQQADDFPAYLSILITGHVMAPIIIALIKDAQMSTAMAAAIILPMMIIMMIALLQPCKGAIIALQWWHGMHDFKKERRPVDHVQD